ncbi:MAG: LL-diaminopimelate aminotransferase [Halanaerobiales bacterium]|nr:LL-diaminopimelate aminotransferase [Halanaerobiales bacterium]
MENSNRIKNLPPYLFAEIDRMINKAKSEGMDVINFGIGDPDQPTPENIVNKMKEAVQDPTTHSYPSYEGLSEFRTAVSRKYKKRFDVELDPETEVVSLIGSKEGIAHLPLCYINPGDSALVPDPGYPVYKTSVLLADGNPIMVPLKKENDFLVDLTAIKEEDAEQAKIMFLNYPNNPTGAIASLEFFEEVIEFAKKYNIIIAHDAAYTDIYLDDNKPHSILEVKGAKDVAIEFNSLSKPYNMTGWRIGWASGNKDVIESLGRLKTNIDSGIFEAIQYAGIEALYNGEQSIKEVTELYKKRRDLLVEGLSELGWNIKPNKATFYLWLEVPEDMNSSEFSKKLFKKTGVFFTPGVGWGEYGENYLRIALTVSQERIKEALNRIEESGFLYK